MVCGRYAFIFGGYCRNSQVSALEQSEKLSLVL